MTKLEEDLKAAKNAFPPAEVPCGAWVCPMCGRVYGPIHPECYPCNRKVGAKQNQAGFWCGPWGG